MPFDQSGGWRSNVLGFIDPKDSVRKYSKVLYGDVWQKPCYFSQTLGWTKWTFSDKNCCDLCRKNKCATPRQECCFKDFKETGIGCCAPKGSDRDVALGFGVPSFCAAQGCKGDEFTNYNDIRAYAASGCQPLYTVDAYNGIVPNPGRVGPCGGPCDGDLLPGLVQEDIKDPGQPGPMFLPCNLNRTTKTRSGIIKKQAPTEEVRKISHLPSRGSKLPPRHALLPQKSQRAVLQLDDAESEDQALSMSSVAQAVSNIGVLDDSE